MPSPMDEQRRAERSADVVLARDAVTRGLGIALERVAPGFARMRMRVTAAMLNGHGACHGGVLFTFADSTFAVACNTANRVTVAAGAQIEFLAPARLGDVLHAEASVRHQGRRSGLHDIAITGADGRELALFRGRSHRLDEALFDEALFDEVGAPRTFDDAGPAGRADEATT